MVPTIVSEKRNAPRVPVELVAHLQLGSRFLREPVGNLSMSGLYLRTRERARPGTPVRLALALPLADGPRFVTVRGEVARVTREGLGVSFAADELATVDRATLETFLVPRLPLAEAS